MLKHADGLIGETTVVLGVPVNIIVHGRSCNVGAFNLMSSFATWFDSSQRVGCGEISAGSNDQ